MRRAVVVLAAIAALAVLAPAAMAHPLGNFSINHLSTIKISEDRVDVLYVLDEAEIPTTQQRGDSRAEVIRSKQEELRESQRSMQTLLSNLPGMAYRSRPGSPWRMEPGWEKTFDTPGAGHVAHLNNAGASLVPHAVRQAVDAHLDLEEDDRAAVRDRIEPALFALLVPVLGQVAGLEGGRAGALVLAPDRARFPAPVVRSVTAGVGTPPAGRPAPMTHP